MPVLRVKAARALSRLSAPATACAATCHPRPVQDRAFRDDERCRAKYGSSWKRYSELVPYKMVPYVW